MKYAVGERVRIRFCNALGEVVAWVNPDSYTVRHDKTGVVRTYGSAGLAPAEEPKEENMTKNERLDDLEERAERLERSVANHESEFEEHEAAIGKLDRLIALCAPAFPPDKDAFDQRLSNAEEALAALARDYTKHKARANQLRNGPQSYDKRIAALETMLADLDENKAYASSFEILCDRVNASAERIASLEANVADHEQELGGEDSAMRLNVWVRELASKMAAANDVVDRRLTGFEARATALEQAYESRFLGRCAGPCCKGCDGSCQAAEDAMHERLYGREEQCDCFMCGGESRGDIDVSHDPALRDELIAAISVHTHGSVPATECDKCRAYADAVITVVERFVNQASRDEYASDDQSSPPLRRATYSEIVDELARRK